MFFSLTFSSFWFYLLERLQFEFSGNVFFQMNSTEEGLDLLGFTLKYPPLVGNI